MGRQYVHISSRDRKLHERTSEMHIQLSNPIFNATEVKMVSFSTANDIYNVSAGNNAVTFNLYTVAGGLVNDAAYAFQLHVPPGLYTVNDLVDTLNRATSLQILPLDVTTLVFSISPDTQRVSLTVRSTTDIMATLVYPRVRGFYGSVLHRLGFSREQISPTLEAFGNEDGNIIARNINDEFGSLAEAPYEIWNCASSDLSQTSKQAESVGFENYPMLYMHSRGLVSDTVQTHMNSDGTTGTSARTILSKIPINVSTYSWVHLTGAEKQFIHTLGGKTISSFDLFLTDHLHEVFANEHVKPWEGVLEFTFQDDDPNVNAAAIQAISDLGFQRRHGCS